MCLAISPALASIAAVYFSFFIFMHNGLLGVHHLTQRSTAPYAIVACSLVWLLQRPAWRSLKFSLFYGESRQLALDKSLFVLMWFGTVCWTLLFRSFCYGCFRVLDAVCSTREPSITNIPWLSVTVLESTLLLLAVNLCEAASPFHLQSFAVRAVLVVCHWHNACSMLANFPFDDERVSDSGVAALLLACVQGFRLRSVSVLFRTLLFRTERFISCAARCSDAQRPASAIPAVHFATAHDFLLCAIALASVYALVTWSSAIPFVSATACVYLLHFKLPARRICLLAITAAITLAAELASARAVAALIQLFYVAYVIGLADLPLVYSTWLAPVAFTALFSANVADSVVLVKSPPTDFITVLCWVSFYAVSTLTLLGFVIEQLKHSRPVRMIRVASGL